MTGYIEKHLRGDIVEVLRRKVIFGHDNGVHLAVAEEGADEIERLRANYAELSGQWERLLANYHSADSRAETARNAALEEAAKVVDGYGPTTLTYLIAQDIRALKEKARD